MRMPRPRFKVWWLMVAVAVVAAVILAVDVAGEWMWRHHRSQSLERAEEAGKMERNYASLSLEIVGDPSMARSQTVFALMPDGNGIVEFRRQGDGRRVFYPSGSAQPADTETVEKLAKWCREVAVRHGELRRKYERAARYPWLSVAPDPTPSDLIAMPEQ